MHWRNIPLVKPTLTLVRHAKKRLGRQSATELETQIDLQYYQQRYQDLTGLDESQLADHWLKFGSAEERRSCPQIDGILAGLNDNTDPSRETVFLVLHEASRSGAPILGWNIAKKLSETKNVVIILPRGGELIAALSEVSAAVIPLFGQWDKLELDYAAQALRERFNPKYAIVNSAVSFPIAIALEHAEIPVIALVHEFAGSLRGPSGPLLGEFFDTVTEVVFPSQIVAEAAWDHHYPYDKKLRPSYHIIPQGKPELPSVNYPTSDNLDSTISTPDKLSFSLPEITMTEFLANLDPDTILVLGVGLLIPRKGVDIFVQTADYLQRHFPQLNVRFAWIGEQTDYLYSDQISEHIKRANLQNLDFLSPVTDLNPLYERADIYLLVSRLDPMPNSAIEAVFNAVPVIAFDKAGGISDWLQEDERHAKLVVPYGDPAATANVISRLVENQSEREEIGTQLKARASETFNLNNYIDQLDELGAKAHSARSTPMRDGYIINASGVFNPSVYADRNNAEASMETLVTDFVSQYRGSRPWAHLETRPLPLRRPCAGFHPLIYAESNKAYQLWRDGDPFAHYLQNGQPAGRWRVPIITPDDAGQPELSDINYRVLVHGHYYRPEMLSDLLQRLSVNSYPIDLRITTTSIEKVEQSKAILRTSGIANWQVLQIPNSGRNFGALLTGLDSELSNYDAVLHLHSKQSPQLPKEFSDIWNHFLLENLVGGQFAMLDRTVSAFAADPLLGLVFPDDPYLSTWDLNRGEAEVLAQRFGLETPLTTHFDFPNGGMFWVRPAAVRRLLNAKLQWGDYPAEPLPGDGTMLHALERLIPFIVEDAGYQIAKTRVPGVNR